MSRVRVLAAFAAARWRPGPRGRGALERHQRRRLAAHLRFLRASSPLFRDRFEALGIDRRGIARDPRAVLARMPLSDKRSMMADFDRLNTADLRLADVEAVALDAERSRDFGVTLGGIAVGLSSGTSGHRGVFVTSPAERDQWAGTVLALTLPRRRRLRGHRVALFLRADNELYQTVRSKAVDFRFYDTHGDLAAAAADLVVYRPTILAAPPSVLDLVAQHMTGSEGRGAVRPEKVYSIAEVLTDSDARRLAASFGQERLHQLYQCTEGLLASTCERGTIHLNERVVMFEREPIDARRFVPIVTDLRRRTQPIVRYRLNDILVERAEPCSCGESTTALERIEGREDDTLILAGVPVFADTVTRAILRAEGFTQYRVRQLPGERDRLEIALDDLSASAGVAAALRALWQRLGIPPPHLEFIAYTHDVSNKLRRVQRLTEKDTP